MKSGECGEVEECVKCVKCSKPVSYYSFCSSVAAVAMKPCEVGSVCVVLNNERVLLFTLPFCRSSCDRKL